MKRRALAASSAAITLFLIAGCATNTPASGPKVSENTPESESLRFVGRLSLVVDSPAGSGSVEQSFSGSFELRGNALAGELDLLSPLGQIVMQLRWQPDRAEILRGKESRQFASAQALLEQATGASITLNQLFAWLQGKQSAVQTSDWQVDLSSHAQGRITARRSMPTPAVLRIALEQP